MEAVEAVLEQTFLLMLYAFAPGLPGEATAVRPIATLAECVEAGEALVQDTADERPDAAVYYTCLPAMGLSASR